MLQFTVRSIDRHAVAIMKDASLIFQELSISTTMLIASHEKKVDFQRTIVNAHSA